MATQYRIMSDDTTNAEDIDYDKVNKMKTLSVSDLPDSENKAQKCFNCKYYFLISIFIFISIIPLIKIIVDVWTFVIYLNYKESQADKTYNVFNDIHMTGLLLFFLTLFSTRSYVVLFCGTMDNRSMFMDNDITKNLYRIIPFVGALLAELFHEKYCFGFSVLSFCQYICFELGLLIGIVFAPWVMGYVFWRSLKINKKWIFLKLNGMDVMYELDTKNNKKKISQTRSGSTLQLLYKYEEFVGEKLEKYQVQLLLLKFCQCFFEAIPQMVVQIYVYINDKHNYNIYNNQIHLYVFYISIATSGFVILQFLCECCLTRKRHLIEIFY